MRKTPAIATAASLVIGLAGMGAVWLLVDRTQPRNPTSHAGPAPMAAPTFEPGSGKTPDPDVVAETAVENAIPVRAMQAYAQAEIAQREANPACNLAWNYLAAIGSVESAHGTISGAGLDANGVPSKRIVGPPLDGTNGTRAIRATAESTKYTGDDRWDRAVGPFQFLTSTWAKFGVDADGDGEADPNDIDDAALAAARHLCANNVDLSTNDWGRAVYGYNNSDDYVAKVRDIAASYAR